MSGRHKAKELQRALYESEADALQRDYDEFKAPDVDNDDVISVSEFGSYIKNYMKAYPLIPESDYPTFYDFDKNRDGLVTFREWQAYLKDQAKKADPTPGAKPNDQQKAVNDLSDKASGSQSFQALYEKLKNA